MSEATLLEVCEKLGLILCRTAGLFSLFPLGVEVIPARVRAGAAIVLSLTLLPLVPARVPGSFVLQLVTETSVGLLAALFCRLPLAAIEGGLQIASVSAGLGIATLLDPATDEEVHALTELLNLAALLVFFAIGGHHQLLAALHRSLLLMPPGAARPIGECLRVVAHLGASFFALAIQVAAPVMLVALALNLALALVSRAAPAVNIFSVSLVAVLLVGLLSITRGLPLLFTQIQRAAAAAPAHFLLGFGQTGTP